MITELLPELRGYIVSFLDIASTASLSGSSKDMFILHRIPFCTRDILVSAAKQDHLNLVLYFGHTRNARETEDRNSVIIGPAIESGSEEVCRWYLKKGYAFRRYDVFQMDKISVPLLEMFMKKKNISYYDADFMRAVLRCDRLDIVLDKYRGMGMGVSDIENMIGNNSIRCLNYLANTVSNKEVLLQKIGEECSEYLFKFFYKSFLEVGISVRKLFVTNYRVNDLLYFDFIPSQEEHNIMLIEKDISVFMKLIENEEITKNFVENFFKLYAEIEKHMHFHLHYHFVQKIDYLFSIYKGDMDIILPEGVFDRFSHCSEFVAKIVSRWDKVSQFGDLICRTNNFNLFSKLIEERNLVRDEFRSLCYYDFSIQKTGCVEEYLKTRPIEDWMQDYLLLTLGDKAIPFIEERGFKLTNKLKRKKYTLKRKAEQSLERDGKKRKF